MSVKSAVRVLEIFELLRDHPQGLNIKELQALYIFRKAVLSIL
jgi:hypothetical protein